MNLSDGKKKDLIIEYIINVYETKNRLPSSDAIKRDVFPDCSLDELNFLLRQIEMHEPKIIKMYFGMSSSCVTEIYYAKPFLDKGGFVKIEKNDSLKTRKEIFDFRISKFQYYTFWPIFAFALIGFGLSIFNFLHSQKEDKKDNSEKLDNKNIDTINKNTDTLKKSKIIQQASHKLPNT